MAKRELAAANLDRARLELEFEQPYLLRAPGSGIMIAT